MRLGKVCVYSPQLSESLTFGRLASAVKPLTQQPFRNFVATDGVSNRISAIPAEVSKHQALVIANPLTKKKHATKAVACRRHSTAMAPAASGGLNPSHFR